MKKKHREGIILNTEKDWFVQTNVKENICINLYRIISLLRRLLTFRSEYSIRICFLNTCYASYVIWKISEDI